jgi:hypothetical protein
MAEVLRHRLDRLAGVDEHRGVEMAEGVHTVRPERRHAAFSAGFQMWLLK